MQIINTVEELRRILDSGYYTVDQAAAILRRSTRTIYRRCRQWEGVIEITLNMHNERNRLMRLIPKHCVGEEFDFEQVINLAVTLKAATTYEKAKPKE